MSQQPDLPPPDATLSELRDYAEQVSMKAGMITVIVAAGGTYHEYVVATGDLPAHLDPVSAALIEALRQREMTK